MRDWNWEKNLNFKIQVYYDLKFEKKNPFKVDEKVSMHPHTDH